MYCSYECRSAVYRDMKPSHFNLNRIAKDIHDFLLGLKRGNFKKVRHVNNQHPKTVFDFKFDNPNFLSKELDQFECFLGLTAANCGFVVSGENINGNEEILNNFLGSYTTALDIDNVCKRNVMPFLSMEFPSGKMVTEATCVPLFGSLINHSCDPNIHIVFVGNKIVYHVLKPIKEGEQLFITYRCEQIIKHVIIVKYLICFFIIAVLSTSLLRKNDCKLWNGLNSFAIVLHVSII